MTRQVETADASSQDSNSGARRFLRRDDVSRATGLPVSTIYAMMAKGTFPKNFKISPRLTAWDEADIAKWQEERRAAATKAAA